MLIGSTVHDVVVDNRDTESALETKLQSRHGDILLSEADGMSSTELRIGTTTISTNAELDTDAMRTERPKSH